MSDPLRVCFYRRDAYGLFDSRSKTLYGGAEVRSYLLAREVARRPEFDVSFMVRHEPTLLQQVGDISLVSDGRVSQHGLVDRVYNEFREYGDPHPSFPYFRFRSFSPRILWQLPVLVTHRLVRPWFEPWMGPYRPRPRRVYRDAKAQVFCCFGPNSATADVIASGRRWGFRTVVFILSDHEVDRPYQPGQGFVVDTGTTGHLLWYVLTHADAIVAQTDRQAACLQQNFGREATVVRNPIDVGQPPASGQRRHVLWIGRAETAEQTSKRPRLLVALARRCPQIPFLAVMNPTVREEFDRIVAESPANLRIVERIPFSEIDECFRDAGLFLSTSAFEGFPNAFLQAAKFAVPIVSLAVDPGEILSRYRAGVCCADDLNQAATEITRLWTDTAAAAELGRAGRAYVERFHDLRVCGDAVASLLFSQSQIRAAGPANSSGPA